MFNFAIEKKGHIKENPVTRKRDKPYKARKEKKMIVTDEEYRAIYDNAADHLKPQLTCYWNTGMRKSELLNLQCKDVDLEKRIITIPAENAKSSKYRDIPINDELLPVMKEQIKEKAPDDYVFTHYGKRMKNNFVAFKGAIEQAEITRKIKLHDFRHTFASRLIKRGVSPKVVKEILGHVDLKITDQYCHLDDEMMHNAVNRLNGNK